MTTTETRDEFRERITTVGRRAFHDALGASDPDEPNRAMAEAIYAEAMRDIVDRFDTAIEAGSYPIDTHDLHGVMRVLHYAQSLGIDLTESEDK